MDLSLHDKVALVTGASRGLGWAIAQTLAAEGMHLALAARTERALRELAGRVEALGRRALVFPADLVDPAAAPRFVAAALDAGDRRGRGAQIYPRAAGGADRRLSDGARSRHE